MNEQTSQAAGGEAKPVDAMSFEEAMAALENIVGRLESGRVDLESSIALYERGAALRKHCETKLRSAEMKVEQIIQNADGAAATKPLDVAG